ncbi:hypothetical protein [Desulfobacula phenolica]|uniref:Zinc-or iron-chelating domain-containing protein n=1 Tax=Desulfobacula phenolica TaxID=90732 RepID=A0A1H2FD61_9BACT|nr:hypothetical protein [Desulfobacula phenolica]SDU05284.1 hypothetical protein SAMN04487931_10492 [Desulfobacula phenolica]
MKKQMSNPGIERLKKIYSLYDEAMDHMEGVCQKKCSSCCTCNVTLTTLEAEFLIEALTQREKKELQARINHCFPQKRYIPKMTTNRFARLCVEGKEVPEEENDPSWGKCPLLADDLCVLYEVRPFGCRALMSQVHCSEKGYAQVPPIVLTFNTLFSQVIEHVDENGFFGNLSDMLTLFLSDNTFMRFSDPAGIPDDGRFVFNEKIPVLMIPLEHRERVKSFWKKLSSL